MVPTTVRLLVSTPETVVRLFMIGLMMINQDLHPGLSYTSQLHYMWPKGQSTNGGIPFLSAGTAS